MGSKKRRTTGRPWLVHLDEETRSTMHSALVDLSDALARPGAIASMFPGGGGDGMILPRAIRLAGRPRAARITLLPNGRLSVSASGMPMSPHAFLHVLGHRPRGSGLGDVLGIVSRWRDGLGDADAGGLAATASRDHLVRRIMRGCIDLLDLPWRHAWISLGPRGGHVITLTIAPDRYPSTIHFASKPEGLSLGTMTTELTSVLDEVIAGRTHVFDTDESRLSSEWPAIRIGRGYDFHIRPEGDALDTMRAIRAVPPGARLITPCDRRVAAADGQ